MMLGFGKFKEVWVYYQLYRKRGEMLNKLKSRKLWAAVASAALVALFSQMGLPESLTDNIVKIAMTYIGGQAAVDLAAALKK